MILQCNYAKVTYYMLYVICYNTKEDGVRVCVYFTQAMLTWASLLLRGLPKDVLLQGAQSLETSQLLCELRVGQSQVHPGQKTSAASFTFSHLADALIQSDLQ